MAERISKALITLLQLPKSYLPSRKFDFLTVNWSNSAVNPHSVHFLITSQVHSQLVTFSYLNSLRSAPRWDGTGGLLQSRYNANGDVVKQMPLRWSLLRDGLSRNTTSTGIRALWHWFAAVRYVFTNTRGNGGTNSHEGRPRLQDNQLGIRSSLSLLSSLRLHILGWIGRFLSIRVQKSQYSPLCGVRFRGFHEFQMEWANPYDGAYSHKDWIHDQ